MEKLPVKHLKISEGKVYATGMEKPLESTIRYCAITIRKGSPIGVYGNPVEEQ